MVISLYATRGDQTGEIEIQWHPEEGASCYIIQMSPAGKKNHPWKHIDIVNSSKYTITGLKPSKSYAFRIAAVSNGSGQGSWSEPIVKKAK